MFTVENLSYLAGIIDGEGCIGLEHLSPTKGRKKSYYVCRLTVINTSEKLMKRLIQTFKGKYDARKKIAGRKTCYRWHVFGNDLEIALKALLPYLFIKKTQAELVLKYRETVSATCRLITNETLEYRKILWQNCKHLNSIGD